MGIGGRNFILDCRTWIERKQKKTVLVTPTGNEMYINEQQYVLSAKSLDNKKENEKHNCHS